MIFKIDLKKNLDGWVKTFRTGSNYKNKGKDK